MIENFKSKTEHIIDFYQLDNIQVFAPKALFIYKK